MFDSMVDMAVDTMSEFYARHPETFNLHPAVQTNAEFRDAYLFQLRDYEALALLSYNSGTPFVYLREHCSFDQFDQLDAVNCEIGTFVDRLI